MKHELAQNLKQNDMVQSHTTNLTHQRTTFSSKCLRHCALTVGRLGITGLVALTLIGVASQKVAAQIIDNLEVGGGYVHVSGDGGLNGYNLAGGLWMNQRISLNAEFDSAYNSSVIGVFSTTSIGHTAVKSHIENYLFGPRFFFPTKNIKKYRFEPFAEVEIGGSHLNQKIQQFGNPTLEASSNSFTWLLGGGAEYRFNNQWSGRMRLDFLRTHFADTGQSRWKLVLGVAYTIAPRGPKL